MRVIGIAGSIRQDSETLKAVRVALDFASKCGGEVELIDLRRVKLPLYDPDADPSAEALDLVRRIEEADALVIGTPVYHGSMSGALKNALDYVSSLEGKVVALVSVAGGMAGTNAITSLQFVVHSLHGHLLPSSAALSDIDSAAARDRLERLSRELVALASKILPPFDHCTKVAHTITASRRS